MKKKVIAIFEDDVVNRFIYQRLFQNRKKNFDVHIFDSPEKGIEMAKEINFDIVYIEIHFWENYGGIPILKKLREVCSKEMIAVGVTSFLQKGDLEYILSCGFDMCIEKPNLFSGTDISDPK